MQDVLGFVTGSELPGPITAQSGVIRMQFSPAQLDTWQVARVPLLADLFTTVPPY